MIIKNNVYDKIKEDSFIINKPGNYTELGEITIGDIDISNRKFGGDIIETGNIKYIVTNPITNLGYVICAYDKDKDNITPIVYGDKDQHITFAEGVQQERHKGDRLDELRIRHEGNNIIFTRDYLWFIKMELLEEGNK